MQDQRAFARAITHLLSEGVVILNQAGQITMVNAAAEHMLGWNEVELVGLRLRDAIPMQSRGMPPTVWDLSHFSTIARGEWIDRRVAVVLTRRDGHSCDVRYSAAQMMVDTQAIGVVLTLQDITDTHHLQERQEASLALLAEQQTLLIQQVDERTRELERTTVTLHAEIHKRQRSEQTRQLLLAELVSAQEDERRRIARELHDQMGQNVAALLLAIKALQDGERDARAMSTQFARLHLLGTQIGQDVRTLAVQLRPPALDDFGLVPTMTTYVQQWSAQTLIAVEVYTIGLDDTRVPSIVEMTAFRIVQESLTNIMRHAHATNVSVILHRRSEALHIIVEDNGAGFDTDVERQRSSSERRLGLVGMQERVAQLAGKLTVESTPRSGTTVFVSLPLDAHL